MPTTPKDPTQLYLLVGFAVVQWAYVEMALDQCVVTIHTRGGGRTVCADRPTTALNRKLRFLRACFRRVPGLTEYASDGLAILSRVEELAERRNTTVHSAAFGEEGAGQSYMAIRWDLKAVTPNLRQADVSLAELEEVGKKILELALNLAQFSSRLALRFGR